MSSYAVEDQQRMSGAKNYFAWQGRLALDELGRRVVEVGCGVGNFTGLLLDREQVIAVDADAGCVWHLQSRYSPQENLRTFVCDVASEKFRELERFSPDSCICFNVLEHVQEHERALRNMAAILRPGGVIVLLLPAFAGLYGPIDKNLGHYRRYSRDSLAMLARETGLTVKTSYYVNSAGFFGWWANARVFKRQAQSETQIRLFDKLLVPVLSNVEQWVRPPFGQSLFAVLQKP